VTWLMPAKMSAKLLQPMSRVVYPLVQRSRATN
jgi:hypothetical protein